MQWLTIGRYKILILFLSGIAVASMVWAPGSHQRKEPLAQHGVPVLPGSLGDSLLPQLGSLQGPVALGVKSPAVTSGNPSEHESKVVEELPLPGVGGTPPVPEAAGSAPVLGLVENPPEPEMVGESPAPEMIESSFVIKGTKKSSKSKAVKNPPIPYVTENPPVPEPVENLSALEVVENPPLPGVVEDPPMSEETLKLHM